MAVPLGWDAIYRCGEWELKAEASPNRTRAAGPARVTCRRELRLRAVEGSCVQGAAPRLRAAVGGYVRGPPPKPRAAGGRCGRGRRRDSGPRGGAVGGGKAARGARDGRTGSGDGSAGMAAVAAMTAAGFGGAGPARSLSRFRGCLAGALLGDCVGAIYEAYDPVSLTSVLRHVQSLEPDPGSPGSARTGGRGRAHVGRGGRGN